jgi:hypothetical protein
MKTLLVLLLTFFTLTIFSQNNEKIIVDKNDLPPDLLQEIENKQKIDNVKQTMATAKTMATDAKSIGHEIGIAVDEALGAVTKHAETFGETSVGKFTMTMVAIAILEDQIPFLYNSIIGFVFGVPFLIFGNIMLIRLFFRTTNKQKILISKSKEHGKKYEYKDTWFTEGSSDGGAKEAFIICFWVITLIFNVWVIAGIIF